MISSPLSVVLLVVRWWMCASCDVRCLVYRQHLHHVCMELLAAGGATGKPPTRVSNATGDAKVCKPTTPPTTTAKWSIVNHPEWRWNVVDTLAEREEKDNIEGAMMKASVGLTSGGTSAEVIPNTLMIFERDGALLNIGFTEYKRLPPAESRVGLERVVPDGMCVH